MGTAERKAREFKRREEEILVAALDLVNAGDWQGVTIDEIAEKTEISKGTVYNHFKSKDEVYARLFLDFIRMVHRGLERIPPDLDFITRFKETVKTFWRMGKENHNLAVLSQHCEMSEANMNLSPQLVAEIEVLHAKMHIGHRALMEEGIALGLFPEQSIDQMIGTTIGAIKGAMLMELSGMFEGLSYDGFPDYLAEFVLNGLKGG